MCGRLRVRKDFLHVCRLGSVQPCVRPVGAVHMTAGHNALRGSGPGQKPAFDNAMALVGCPDRHDVLFGHTALDLDGTARNVHGACELGQHAVSGRAERRLWRRIAGL
jgi:hypothetical protein